MRLVACGWRVPQFAKLVGCWGVPNFADWLPVPKLPKLWKQVQIEMQIQLQILTQIDASTDTDTIQTQTKLQIQIQIQIQNR